jgi:hypothetical protein
VSPPAAAQAQTASPLAPRRRPPAPTRPRRVSGPALPARGRSAPPPRGAEGGLALGAVALLGRLDALAGHRLLDRLIRSRVWIGIVAFALIGIVTLQLGLLKLNAGIGRALEREGSLQRENAALNVENSELASGGRVETEAAKLGMQLFSVAGLKFLGSAHAGDVSKAAAALRAAPAHEAGAAPSEMAAVAESGSSTALPSSGESSEGTGEAAGARESTTAQGESGSEAPSSAAGASAEPAHGEAAAPSGAAGEASSSTGTSTGAGGGALAPGG